MSLLDQFLYFDEDQDLEAGEMEDLSPVEAAHIIELVERGLVKQGEVFSHKGWHHIMYNDGVEWWGEMWDGPGEWHQRYNPQFNEWE